MEYYDHFGYFSSIAAFIGLTRSSTYSNQLFHSFEGVHTHNITFFGWRSVFGSVNDSWFHLHIITCHKVKFHYLHYSDYI